jgi:hypothetical protein
MNPGLVAVLLVGAYGLYLTSKQNETSATTGNATNSLLATIAKQLKDAASGKSGGSSGGSSGGGGGSSGGSSGGGGGTGGWNDLPQWLQDVTDPFSNPAPIDSTPSYDDTTLIPTDDTPIDDSGIYATVDPFGGDDTSDDEGVDWEDVPDPSGDSEYAYDEGY